MWMSLNHTLGVCQHMPSCGWFSEQYPSKIGHEESVLYCFCCARDWSDDSTTKMQWKTNRRQMECCGLVRMLPPSVLDVSHCFSSRCDRSDGLHSDWLKLCQVGKAAGA